MPQDYEIDIITSVINNQDISINDYGQQLWDLCIAANLRIRNSRTKGDFQGDITNIGYKVLSTVDLLLASQLTFTSSKSAIETLEKGVKYI